MAGRGDYADPYERDYGAVVVPDIVKQFVVDLYRHIRRASFFLAAGLRFSML